MRLTAKDIVLLHLRRHRAESHREMFENTYLGIATATGVPYPRVSESLKVHVRDGHVEVRREHVREFPGEGRMKTFHLTPAGWAETERLLGQVGDERIALHDGTDAGESVSVADAIRNPPAWLPHRLGDWADQLSEDRTVTPAAANRYRQFLALRTDLVRELDRAHSRDRIPVVELASLERRLRRPLAEVEAAVRSLAQETVVEVKPPQGQAGKTEAWVRLKSEPYARFALRGEERSPTQSGSTAADRNAGPEPVPDSAGLCLAARRWLTTTERFRLEDLKARPLETGARARIIVTHVPSGGRFEVTLYRDGSVVDCRAA